MTDDLDALLGRSTGPTDPAAREALFRRTARALARDRFLRRAAAVAAVGLGFAAGVGTAWFGKPTPPAPPPELVSLPVPVPLPVPESPGEVAPVALAAPQLELEAEQATDSAVSAKLYRQAGDKYLAELTDIASATRCYANHLAGAGPDGLAVSADDSWLLIRMKASRTNEGVRQ
jgi:hypothetical protein